MRISDLSSDVCSSDLEVDAIRYAFIGPLVGALSRAGSGWLADRAGGALVTFWVFLVQMVATAGLVWSLAAHSFPLFFTMVLLLFFVSGVGHASTFQMVPGILRAGIDRTSSAADPDERRFPAHRDSTAGT